MMFKTEKKKKLTQKNSHANYILFNHYFSKQKQRANSNNIYLYIRKISLLEIFSKNFKKI